MASTLVIQPPDHGGNIEIAFRRTWRPNADGFVGKAHVERVAVRVTINGNGLTPSSLHAQMTRRAISPRFAMRIS